MADHKTSVHSRVQEYASSFVPPRPPVIAAMEERAKKDGFPIIGPACGWLCYQLARMTGARRVFEMGSGFGYSTYFFALAVRENGGGEVHHTVWDEDLSARARDALDGLGLGELVVYQVSEAIEALAKTEGLFDVVFCDVDKHAYPQALEAAKNKLKPGGVLVFDNMIWDGRIFDALDRKDSTEGVRKAAELIRKDREMVTSLVPLRDGLLVAWKRHG